MLKLLLADALKSPVKLLALCVVIYMASMSFFVGLFVAGLVIAAGISELKTKLKIAKVFKASKPADLKQVKRGALEVHGARPAASADRFQPAPAREHAKSAAVLQFRARARD